MSDVPLERARALARSLPEDLRVVGLLADLPDDRGSLEAVVELASQLGRTRRTLLANLSGSSSGLDSFLESGDAGGLAAVLGGEGRLGEVARRPGTHRFLYLPAGDVGGFHPWLESSAEPSTDPASGDAAAEGGSPLGILLERLTRRIRRADAILVLYMPPELTRAADVAALLDGLVSLSGEPAVEAQQVGLPVVEVAPEAAPIPDSGSRDRPRWELEEAESEPASAEDTSEPDASGERWQEVVSPEAAGAEEGRAEGRWRRHRRPGSAPWGRIALGALAILLLAGGWWVFARTATDGAESEGASGDVAATAAADDLGGDVDGAGGQDEPAPGGGAVAGDTAAGEPSADGQPRPPADSVVISAPELTHSVLVASYASLEQARGVAEAWTREDDLLYFVAPTRIDGKVYHRLFAGAFPSFDDAERAMERLVEMGRKDAARAWDARPAGLAHRLRTTRDETEATELRDRLTGDGVPAYVLLAAAGGDTVYQVYAGAYERAGQSALAGALRAAGRDAELVTRKGAPRTP
ncbi:MAG: SPOR domain-containing protein [Gemmatimonadota bacterium]